MSREFDFANCSIVIATFEKRFFEFALPLISSIRTATNIPITIVVNGNYKVVRDEKNYRDFVIATQRYSNVSLVTFNTFRGWSSMINAGILHSDSDFTIIFNDDVYLNSTGFVSELAKVIDNVSEIKLALINNSWSHFAITRECLAAIGFFDEHFLGIGEEDGDYAYRYKRHFGKDVPSITLSGLVNFVDTSRDESIAVTNGKYSLFNSVYLKFKLGAGKESANPGTLSSIYSWRSALYQSLGWSNHDAVHEEIIKSDNLRNSPVARKK
jgi:predicted glycosyltransferase involved in capsule biosynthesis